ncbi:MAG: hypothetical protein J0H86_07345 [Xanthomonadaceae bacterium]|nr:hypothetical protein [Xanthomonadaceae bacterium]
MYALNIIAAIKSKCGARLRNAAMIAGSMAAWRCRGNLDLMSETSLEVVKAALLKSIPESCR